MKKLLYTLLAVSIFFSACEKEDSTTTYIDTNNDNNNTSDSIVGSWDFTEYQYIQSRGYYLGGYPNGTKIITFSNGEIMLPGDTSWDIQSVNWDFKSEGAVIQTFVYTDSVRISTSVWVKNGNTLTIDTNDIFSIETLSSSQLTINMIEEDHDWEPNNDTLYFNEMNTSIKWNRSSFNSDNSTSKVIQSNKDYFFIAFIDRN